ncbi:CGNR zinc finger domain-containing protein [Asanoa sp. WMMD1127]|uniref:CGNR zinc finger domain-containing protein n=1 Tax=Asanoa sp. WMMD1127 TaxID=3016107 RepID=UPI002416F3E9|nr:CGNR zinc finger domain-containing protein [Asanoa sp. WMMD1127]MDG4823379.1 CGNR zinc finger domain-containing protein [Asanoa sp. WMMD1127]
MPAQLAPVLAFVNSMDVELGTDEWDDGPAALATWLTAAGIAGEDTTVTDDDLALARELRTGLRAMTLANNGVPAPAAARRTLTRALARFPLTASPDGLTSGALFGPVVAGYAHGVATGEFARMRQCPAGDCSWVFWDSSAKGGRKWCTMGVCGNRAKARAYAARRRRP